MKSIQMTSEDLRIARAALMTSIVRHEDKISDWKKSHHMQESVLEWSAELAGMQAVYDKLFSAQHGEKEENQ